MDIDSVIRQIQLSASNSRLTKVERERLAGELSVVHERLRKGDYQRFSYTTNTFDAPNRAQDVFTELEFYCLLGQTWAALLKDLDVNRFPKIADLCPGYTPKVELALFYLDYAGEVVVLDNEARSISQLQKFMTLFNPKFTITKKVVNLFGSFRRSYDLVLANHIIDDLILYQYSQKSGIPLSAAYESEHQMMELWQGVLKNKEEFMPEIVPLITGVFLKTVNKGGYLCLSQYKSYMEKMLSIDEAPRFSKQVFKNVVQELERKGFIRETDKMDKAFATFKGHFGPNDCVILRRQK